MIDPKADMGGLLTVMQPRSLKDTNLFEWKFGAGGQRMTDYVWVSNALNHEAEIGVSVNLKFDRSDDARRIEAFGHYKEGAPISAELCPKRIWSEYDPRDPEMRAYAGPTSVEDGLPDLFCAGGYWIVSEHAANILASHDLGSGALHHVREGVFHADNTTKAEGEYFCWVFGNQKGAFSGPQSKNLRAPKIEGLWWKMAFEPSHGDVAVDFGAIDGADVWMDPMLFKTIFLSSELGDDLSSNGLGDAFMLFKARVV